MKLDPSVRDDRLFCSIMQSAERMRERAWQGYLDATRAAERYEEIEPQAWNALQERLSAIDQELMSALAAAV